MRLNTICDGLKVNCSPIAAFIGILNKIVGGMDTLLFTRLQMRTYEFTGLIFGVILDIC
jgi:hypothetical protein